MSRLRIFVGSSQKNVEVARLIANRLESDALAEPTVWDEGVFSLNQGFLERLLAIRGEFDFAVLVWAPDDVTESIGDSRASPRDNVVFECGLFMGALGKDRVFIVCDRSITVKIPSDLAGVTLASYDGSRIGTDSEAAAVRGACDLIRREIEKRRFPTFIGEWTSRYVLAEEVGHPEVTEIVEIKAARGGICIATKQNPGGDFYEAYGRVVNEKEILGEWRVAGTGFAGGVFILKVNTRGNIMYGYNTAPDENNAIVYTTWVLAKNDDPNEIERRLQWGEQQLQEMTFRPPLPPKE